MILDKAIFESLLETSPFFLVKPTRQKLDTFYVKLLMRIRPHLWRSFEDCWKTDNDDNYADAICTIYYCRIDIALNQIVKTQVKLNTI